MVNQYYKNFILWGEVDFYCLICEESFQDLAEVDKHIRWENHRKLLKTQVKSPKFKKEVIFQFGELFYCQFCNYVAPSMIKVIMDIHINGEEHINNKKKPKSEAEITNSACKREAEFVIIKDVIIEDKDWNCITHIENYCIVCCIYIPATYSDVVNHIKTGRHVINLIATKVVVDGDKLYRKLSSKCFYCLSCKEPLPILNFEDHWTSEEHLEFRNDCIFNTTYANANAARAIEEKKRIIEKGLIIKFHKEYYNILEEKESAICKQCQCVVKMDFKIMNDHKKSHSEDTNADKSKPVAVIETSEKVDIPSDEDTYEVKFSKLTDHGQRRKELAIYGRSNYIRLNSGGSKGYCSICCSTISSHLKLFIEHVKGARHRGHLELKGLKKSKVHKFPDIELKTVAEIINNIYFLEELEFLCLNKEICMNVYSFTLVHNTEKRFQYNTTKCLLCDVMYPYSYDFEHYSTKEHKMRFLSAKVVALDGEFIREIRPDVYHCSACNKIYPFWELMEKHLRSKSHNTMRSFNKYKVFEQTFDRKLLKTSSKNPDILYLQLLSIGIIKNNVLTMKDVQVPNLGSIQLNISQVPSVQIP